MNRNKLISIMLSGIVICGVIISCHNKPSDPAGPGAPADPAAAGSAAPKPNLKGLAFAYSKDPACGMPLTAGVEDSLTYKGKLYGFCSKECKDAFLQNPH